MVMTSEPDGQGQRFIPSMCEKIKKYARLFLRPSAGPTVELRWQLHSNWQQLGRNIW